MNPHAIDTLIVACTFVTFVIGTIVVWDEAYSYGLVEVAGTLGITVCLAWIAARSLGRLIFGD